MTGIDDFLDVMAAFQEKSLSASAFVDQFFALREKLNQAQDAAIRQHPHIEARLHQFRAMHGSGAITSDEYLDAVQAEYAHLETLSIPPGSTAARAIDQLFVEADAFREVTGEDDEFPALDEQGLHGAVARALRQLRAE